MVLPPSLTRYFEEYHCGHSDFLHYDDMVPPKLWDCCASLGTVHPLLQSQPWVHCVQALLGKATVSEVSSGHRCWPPLHRHSRVLLSLSLRMLSPLLVHDIHPLRLLWPHVSKSLWRLLPMNSACCLLLLHDPAELFPVSSATVSARGRGEEGACISNATPFCDTHNWLCPTI